MEKRTQKEIMYMYPLYDGKFYIMLVVHMYTCASGVLEKALKS